jgi:hypothetical protein
MLHTASDTCFAIPPALVGPDFGWGCSSCNNIAVTVDRTTVSFGQTPLPAAWTDGKYYFDFAAAPYTWSQWNFWN